jgi:hypothetical protein
LGLCWVLNFWQTILNLLGYTLHLSTGPTSKWLFSRNSRVRVPKLRQLGLSRLWSLVTFRADFGSRCNLKQSCRSCWELSNSMLHVIWRQVNRVDSRLFLVRSQIGSLTFGLSFGHNLCFRCPNEQCEPILDIYVPRAFQWYKERHKPLSFDPWIHSLKFWKSIGTPSPKVGVALGVWRFIPSHFPTLPGVCDVTPGLSLGLHPCNPLALVASPKLGLRHLLFILTHYRALLETSCGPPYGYFHP